MKRRRWIPEVFKALAFAFSTYGFVSNLVNNPPANFGVYIGVVAMVIIYVSLTYFSVRGDRKEVRLQKGSENEANFFATWYLKGGRLDIFCSDLAWLEGKDSIIDALIAKSLEGHLHIYLRYLDHPIKERLFNAGAYIYEVKDSIVSRHRYSMLEDDGLKRAIIRNKDDENDPDYVKLIEITNDQSVMSLLDDLLDDCFNSVLHK
jgi:hypothetical protein